MSYCISESQQHMAHSRCLGCLIVPVFVTGCSLPTSTSNGKPENVWIELCPTHWAGLHKTGEGDCRGSDSRQLADPAAFCGGDFFWIKARYICLAARIVQLLLSKQEQPPHCVLQFAVDFRTWLAGRLILQVLQSGG